MPDQHGAWAMLVVPLLLGVLASGPTWVHLPLAVLWFVGYLDFYAVGRWLKSRFKSRYLPPVRVYSAVLVVPAVAVLWMRPDLLVWLAAFLPLLAVSAWCSYRRKDRSLLNDLVTVLAACLVLPVAFDAGTSSTPTGPTGWPQVWAMFAVVLAYLVGTILYVKTVIREKGRRAYLVGSVGYHMLAVGVVAVVLASAGLAWMPSAVLFAVLCLRAALVPRTGARPMQVGLGEIVASTSVTLLLLLA